MYFHPLDTNTLGESYSQWESENAPYEDNTVYAPCCCVRLDADSVAPCPGCNQPTCEDHMIMRGNTEVCVMCASLDGVAA